MGERAPAKASKPTCGSLANGYGMQGCTQYGLRSVYCTRQEWKWRQVSVVAASSTGNNSLHYSALGWRAQSQHIQREMPRPRSRSRSRSPGPGATSPVLVGAVLPTVDARTPLPPPATPGARPVEIQVQIDRSGYYLGTAMLLFVVLLWILVRLSPSPRSV